MKKTGLIATLFLCTFISLAQRKTGSVQQSASFRNTTYRLDWQNPGAQKISDTETINFLSFKGAMYDPAKDQLPFFSTENKSGGAGNFIPVIKNAETSPVTDQKELQLLNAASAYLGEDFSVQYAVRTARKVSTGFAKILPIRKSKTGGYEKLVSFDIDWLPVSQSAVTAKSAAVNFAANSVLASGKWYKIGVTSSGIYKIDRTFLLSMGIDPDSINPQNIRIYGNGGKMMPESNAVYRTDDLSENAIFVSGESDGVFDNGDYVLFYGQSPHQWDQQSSTSCMKFKHKINVYSDTTFYFINMDLGAGKRIQNISSSTASPNKTVNSFDDYQYYESNASNLIKSGREWYGEYFDILNSYSFSFNFPNIVAGDTISVEAAVANRMATADANAYTVSYPGGSFSLTSGTTSLTNYTAPFAIDGSNCTRFVSSSPNITVSVTKNNTSALGWLNYIRVNARRQLSMTGNQMMFRDSRSVGSGNVSLFSIANSSSSLSVWDVTDIFNVGNQQYNLNGSSIEFTRASDSLKQFIVFSQFGFLTPNYSGEVMNQNLHALSQADYLIISHPDFLTEAQRIAQLHADLDTLSYHIVTPQQIYNEFSSGSPDIVGMRDFIRMFYKRSSGPADAPKFVLLFGDGSYKYKSGTNGNTNYILTYQSPNSLAPTGSYTSDDFFGLLDDSEGDFTNDAVDIGIGRLPSRTLAEAHGMVNKIISYVQTNGTYTTEISSCSEAVTGPLGDWRNWICFIADDEDNNLHLTQSDSLSRMVAREHPRYNINKIFFDAYNQESTPGGEVYPDVASEFDKQVAKGCLILNYTGHGGELGLAHEGVLGISQINAYTNSNRLPLWFTATCEFSRYDDPDRVSAGEYVMLNPNGGGVSLMTTVRLVYANSNFNLSVNMWERALDSINGQIPATGELFMLTKQDVYLDANTRNFTLLGDPALKLAYPRNAVITDSINGVSITSTTDTLKALSKVTVTGHIADSYGNKLSGFNGVIFPTVFDKSNTITTLNNDAGSPSTTFKLQKNIIYRGKSDVKNGEFTFTFIVPKDIAYNYGFGKISYYSHNGYMDAGGYYGKAVVGGSDPNAVADNTGPVVKLYMNDNKFVSGGTTNEDPKIYAEISDSSGINTVGNGIGHDIVSIMDGNSTAPIVLNDYYQADLNRYQSGKILYSLNDLSEGSHSLSLKVWDVQNNSSTAYTDFVVAKSAELALSHVLNYPNPFTTRTQFFMEHNNCCSQLTVSIDVFTISGKVVKSINKSISNDGYRTEGIEWDGKDEYGDKLGRGVYIYKVKIKDDEGKTAEKFEKLVILN